MGFLSKLLRFNRTTVDNNKDNGTETDQQKVEKLLNMLTPLRRTAYLPLTKISDSLFSADSKFGGYPYLRNTQDWPICPNCNNHMQLFLQLNLNDLPFKKENELIQLFYCTNTHPFSLFLKVYVAEK